MKGLFFLIVMLISNCCIAQTDIELKIINDSIKKVSIFDSNTIVFSLKNISKKNYLLVLDFEFNEHPEYYVEPEFIGLLDYYVFENDSIIKPEGVTSNNTNEFIVDTKSLDFKKFYKAYSKVFSKHDIEIAFRLDKKIKVLKPGEEKYFSVEVNFPKYRRRYIDLKNHHPYYFQISLNTPKEIIEKYYLKTHNKYSKDIIFTGQIFSNKVPLLYEVYNDK